MAVDQADLQRSEVLGCLPAAALETLAERARRRSYAAGETVFEEGAPGDCMHLVRSGALEVRRSEGVERYILARLGPGHAFGELAVLDRTPRTATVVAVEATETVEIGAEDLDGVLAEHPQAVRQMLGVLARLLIDEKELVIRDNWMLERRVRERTQDLRHSQLEIVHRLGQVAESRDPETGRHITRMSRVCAHLGKVIGLPPAECETLLHAAPMHDIGKVGVPDSILHKPGPLDDGERDRMRRHTTVGAEILAGSRSSIVRMAEEIAYTHHERWDGSGYPRGLRGTEIPLVGRICAVGDVFDALVSARVYKRAWPIDEAFAELERQAGVLLDPDLVAALVRVRDDLPRLLDPGDDLGTIL
ncbi:MAG: cyclic nucleotide-binding domain-containing protein [Actinomycetota bacterium]|nr:cyclic nucleotide-binding domain-containing protein [Actinomycetota bacterium]